MTLTILDSIVLGIIQGITEWLPISSSGHLVIAELFINAKVPLLYNIILHFATLIVVFLVFHKDILSIIAAFLRLDFKSDDGKLGTFIIIGSIPTAIIGFTFKDFFESLFTNLYAVGIALLFTGIILYLSKFNNGNKPLTAFSSIIIGISQGIAIIPGISRSGTTISAGLLMGLKKESVAKFSFLLSIPAVLGAGLLEIVLGISNPNNHTWAMLPIIPTIIGFIIALIVGYFSLKTLLRIIISNKFHLFSYYCWALGLIITLSFLL